MQKYKAPRFDDYNKVINSLDEPKVSKPILTKYEFDQVIGVRANQIALGSPIFTNVSDINIKSNMELRQVALQELKEGKLPFILKRQLPNNTFEYFKLRDMDLTAVQYMMR